MKIRKKNLRKIIRHKIISELAYRKEVILEIQQIKNDEETIKKSIEFANSQGANISAAQTDEIVRGAKGAVAKARVVDDDWVRQFAKLGKEGAEAMGGVAIKIFEKLPLLGKALIAAGLVFSVYEIIKNSKTAFEAMGKVKDLLINEAVAMIPIVGDIVGLISDLKKINWDGVIPDFEAAKKGMDNFAAAVIGDGGTGKDQDGNFKWIKVKPLDSSGKRSGNPVQAKQYTSGDRAGEIQYGPFEDRDGDGEIEAYGRVEYNGEIVVENFKITKKQLRKIIRKQILLENIGSR